MIELDGLTKRYGDKTVPGAGDGVIEKHVAWSEVSGTGAEDGVRPIDPKTSHGAGGQSGVDRHAGSAGTDTVKPGRRGLR